MKHCPGPLSPLFLLLSLLLAAPVVSHAQGVVAPSPDVDWQVGVIALVGIAIVGGGMILLGNARRRHETRAEEQAARDSAAKAQSAIIGERPDDELDALAARIDMAGFRQRKSRPARPRECGGERDQNMPGSNLQRTRSR